MPTISVSRVNLRYHHGNLHVDFQMHDCLKQHVNFEMLKSAYHYIDLMIHYHYSWCGRCNCRRSTCIVITSIYSCP